MNFQKHNQLIRFLEEELALPADSINLALRHPQPNLALLPIVLWQYGLVTTHELERIWDWLESG